MRHLPTEGGGVTQGRRRFPDPRSTTADGLLAVGGSLDVETLCEAYETGIFPWPQEGLPLLWFSPVERGIIDLEKETHWPSRFSRDVRKWLREGRLEIATNTCFEEVIRSCKEASRKGQDGTWILEEMEDAYIEMHRRGFAHSVEVFFDGDLAGGLYGVFIKGVFSGESMFHRKSDAGKVALAFLIEELRSAGFGFVDVQMVTPVVASFGGVLISREDYLMRLELAQKRWELGVCRYEWARGPVSLSRIASKLNVEMS